MTVLQSANIHEKRSVLRRRIEKWKDVQSIYMPAVGELQPSSPPSDSPLHPENIPLRLPSAIAPEVRSTRCVEGLPDKEWRLRVAQANDALRDLQRLLRVKAGLWHFKGTQVGPSQRSSTRTRSMIARFGIKISRTANRYRSARCALLNLRPDDPAVSHFRELKDEDVKGPHRDPDDVSEGRRELSWIWLVRRSGTAEGDESDESDEAKINDCTFYHHSLLSMPHICSGLRVEWSKARARAARWEEEVHLLAEEMRRILWYLHWRSEWWLRQGVARGDTSLELGEGIVAYAAKQHALLQEMGVRFAAQWWHVVATNGLDVNWPADFIPKSPIPTTPTVDAFAEVDVNDVLFFDDD
jgi:hypothetical protein